MDKLSEQDLFTIKKSLHIAIEYHKNSIKTRNRLARNILDDGVANIYKNANYISEKWIEESENTLRKVNEIIYE